MSGKREGSAAVSSQDSGKASPAERLGFLFGFDPSLRKFGIVELRVTHSSAKNANDGAFTAQ
jgi:hypothetical protein